MSEPPEVPEDVRAIDDRSTDDRPRSRVRRYWWVLPAAAALAASCWIAVAQERRKRSELGARIAEMQARARVFSRRLGVDAAASAVRVTAMGLTQPLQGSPELRPLESVDELPGRLSENLTGALLTFPPVATDDAPPPEPEIRVRMVGDEVTAELGEFVVIVRAVFAKEPRRLVALHYVVRPAGNAAGPEWPAAVGETGVLWAGRGDRAWTTDCWIADTDPWSVLDECTQGRDPAGWRGMP